MKRCYSFSSSSSSNSCIESFGSYYPPPSPPSPLPSPSPPYKPKRRTRAKKFDFLPQTNPLKILSSTTLTPLPTLRHTEAKRIDDLPQTNPPKTFSSVTLTPTPTPTPKHTGAKRIADLPQTNPFKTIPFVTLTPTPTPRYTEAKRNADLFQTNPPKTLSSATLTPIPTLRHTGAKRIVDIPQTNPPTTISSATLTPTRRRTRTKAKGIVDLPHPDHPNTNSTPTPTPSKRSSIHRGVTKHRTTGKFEAHLWDKNTWNKSQTKKGRQIYLGAYDYEDAAACTYDLAALKYWGPTTAILNFPVENYLGEIAEMEKLSRDEYLATLRRKSSGFSRGLSKFRGVARHHHNGRWEARIGRVNGNKYLYLGTFGTQEEAAEAYDLAAIQHKGPNAITNFNISRYADKLKQKNLPLTSSTEILKVEETGYRQQQHPETVGLPQLMDEDVELYRQQNADTFDSPEVMYEELQLQPIVMPEPCDHEQEHLWNLCLETGGIEFDSLPISVSVPYDKPRELPDLFVDTTIDDELAYLFNYDAYDEDINHGDFLSLGSGSGSGTLIHEVEESLRKDDEQDQPTDYPNSSPFSFTAFCTKD